MLLSKVVHAWNFSRKLISPRSKAASMRRRRCGISGQLQWAFGRKFWPTHIWLDLSVCNRSERSWGTAIWYPRCNPTMTICGQPWHYALVWLPLREKTIDWPKEGFGVIRWVPWGGPRDDRGCGGPHSERSQDPCIHHFESLWEQGPKSKVRSPECAPGLNVQLRWYQRSSAVACCFETVRRYQSVERLVYGSIKWSGSGFELVFLNWIHVMIFINQSAATELTDWLRYRIQPW